MNAKASLRTVEPLAAVRKYPRAAMLGGVASAIALGGFSAVVGGPVMGMLMAVLGIAVGAPGGAHLAEAAEMQRRPV